MTSFSAKLKTTAKTPKLVVFVIYNDIVLLDLVGPLQVFSHALEQQTGRNGYRCAVTSINGGMVNTNTVVSIPSTPMSDLVKENIHTLIIVGGDGANHSMYDNSLLTKIKKLASKTHRICSVCSGALVLAATGLLDGRRAVTHWDDCAMLASEFPNVQVEVDPIYIKDGHMWTSAGITAGIDMALAIVSEDLGRQSALMIAQSMVTQMARTGGQSQFSPMLGRQLLDSDGQFEVLHAWISENLQANLGVERLAEKVNMSTRNFSRVYAKQLGTTPAKAVEVIRTETAKELLETSQLSVKEISTRCGFNDEERMRRTFIRLLNVSPSDYRQTFQAA